MSGPSETGSVTGALLLEMVLFTPAARFADIFFAIAVFLSRRADRFSS
jgi:hypothetical protein